MRETDFLRRECASETHDEQNAAAYDDIYEQVEAEQMCEWVEGGFEIWTFRPQGQAIHAEVVRRMQQRKNSLQD
jgi:hypothetical protein